jgi:hypothetical protein
MGKKIALADSEYGSASKYANLFEFDTLKLTTFSPDVYISAIITAENNGYDVLVIDGISPAWAGEGGVLEIVDKETKRDPKGNSFSAWRVGSPKHQALVQAILKSSMHIICTCRVKTEYVLEVNQYGKQVPRKIGMKPVQRDGLEYEFDIIANIDANHEFTINETRCPELDGFSAIKAGGDVAEILMAWLSDGTPIDSKPVALADGEYDDDSLIREELRQSIKEAIKANGYNEIDFYQRVEAKYGDKLINLSVDSMRAILETITKKG